MQNQAESCEVNEVVGQVEGARERWHCPKAFSMEYLQWLPGAQNALYFSVLNEPWGPDGPLIWPGDSVSLALGLGGPQTPALWCQSPWEGHIGGRPMVSVSPRRPTDASQQLWCVQSGRPK